MILLRISATMFALALVGLAFCWPQRLSTWSWLELSQQLESPSASMEQQQAMGQPYFRQLHETLKTEAQDEHWLAWTKDRTGALFFPIDDPRGSPTRVVLKLLVELANQGDHRSTWRKELERLKREAPEGAWGELENLGAALMTASTQLDAEAYHYWITPLSDSTLLQKAAAWLQVFPHRRVQQLELHDQTPATLLPRLYERMESYGQPAFMQALHLCRHHPDMYLLWLVDGRPVREDWQTLLWRKTSFALPLESYYTQPWGKLLPAACLLLAFLMHLFFGFSSLLRRSPLAVLALIGIYVGLLAALEVQTASESVPLQLQWENIESRPSLSSTIDPQVSPVNSDFNTGSLYLIIIFLVLQMLVLLFSCMAMSRIQKSEESPEVRLRLLENEEYLFDLGLYIGLGGTVMSLIFILMGQNQQGMIAAYASTMFGILEVAIFKVFILRPFRHKLILQC